MQPWNDVHYARVQEFTRLLADALANAATPPTSVPPPAPSAAIPAEPAATANPAPRPTASTTFGKIPWKK